MNLQEVHKAVSKIKTTIFKQSNYQTIGALKSSIRGSGLQFKEHRVYTHGDDVRFIDWKLLAKTNTPFVKTFEEERNVEIMVIIDASPSMFYGFKNKSKLQASIEIACLLYLLAKETSDYVQVTLKSDDIQMIPKMSGDEGITRLINLLQRKNLLLDDGTINYDFWDEHEKELPNVTKLLKYTKRKKEMVILSDFLNFLDEKELKRIVYQKRVHAFALLSPIDYQTKLPFEFKIRDLANGKNHIRNIFSQNEKIYQILSGRVKTLKVDDNYLEEFIKEMM